MTRETKYPGLKTGLVVFITLTAIFLVAAPAITGGEFVYALDDAYIHMAVAKHLVNDGVWGVNKHEVSSCTSSILWPLLVSIGFALVGPNVYVPLALNVLFGIALLAYVSSQLRKNGVPASKGPFLAILFVVCTPFIYLTFIGMEHLAQTLFSLAFMVAAANILAKGKPSVAGVRPLLLLAPLVTLSRYEGLFLIAIVCVLLTFRGGFFPGVLVCLAAILPLTVFGLFMAANGYHFLPNSVLIKASEEALFQDSPMAYFGKRFFAHLAIAPHLLSLSIALVAGLWYNVRRGRTFWSKPVLFLFIPIAATCLHLEFASVIWLRYEAYLVPMALFALAVTIGPVSGPGLSSAGWKRIAVWMLLVFPVARGLLCLAIVPPAIMNIHQQQVQMAKFVKAYYAGQAVALNDIGAVSFYGDVDLLDLRGLANANVADAMLDDSYSPDLMDALARERGVKIAIVYEPWFWEYGGMPVHWIKVAQWTIPHNVTCGRATVDIYGVQPGEAENLVRHLKSFSDELPEQVQQRGARRP